LSSGSPPPDEETLLQADERLWQAVDLFNAGDWYGCHDGFEALWHETQGPMRPVLQGLLQIAVAELHLARGNRRGATVLMGEGLGRLRRCDDEALGLALAPLRVCAAQRLQALQQQADLASLPLPRLELARAAGTAPVH
jgi:predicted metal-dependent hydrolase